MPALPIHRGHPKPPAADESPPRACGGRLGRIAAWASQCRRPDRPAQSDGLESGLLAPTSGSYASKSCRWSESHREPPPSAGSTQRDYHGGQQGDEPRRNTRRHLSLGARCDVQSDGYPLRATFSHAVPRRAARCCCAPAAELRSHRRPRSTHLQEQLRTPARRPSHGNQQVSFSGPLHFRKNVRRQNTS